MTRRTVWILVTSAGLVMLICVGVLVWGLMAFLSGGRVGPLIADLKARGEPIRAADVAPPRVPDSRNAAVVYAKAFKLLPKNEADRNLRELSDLVSRAGRRIDPKQWQQARRTLSQYKNALVLAEKAAARSKCAFPIDWAQGIEVELPHLRKLRMLVELLTAQALIEAHSGRANKALRSINLAVKTAEALRDEPILVSYLARVALLNTTLRRLTDICSQGPIDPEEARRLDATLSRIELVRTGVNALRGERAFGIDLCEQLIQGSFGDRRRAPAGGGQPDVLGKIPAPGHAVLRTVFRRDQAYYIRAMTDSIDHADLPYRTLVVNSRSAPTKRDSPPSYAIVSSAMLPRLGRILYTRDSCVARIAGSRILLALGTYRGRFRFYPAALSELPARLDWTPPPDPFTGKDFVYKRQGAGFLLYSIGPNLEDDGGAEPKPSKRQAFAIPSGDIPWRIDRAR